MKSHNYVVRPAGVVEVGEAEVNEHQLRRSHPITTFAFFAIFARTRTTTITIAPLVLRQRPVDQHVPRLAVPVHYAGCVKRVQRYQEVAEVLLHIALRQVIALLAIIVVVFPSVADAIMIVPAVGCAARCRRRVGFGTSVHRSIVLVPVAWSSPSTR